MNLPHGNFFTDPNGIIRSEIFSQYINILNVQILDHGYFNGDERWNQFGISSPYSRIYFMEENSGWIEEDTKRTDLVPGKMYLITPNTMVNLRTKSKINKYFFHVRVNIYDYDIFENCNNCFDLKMEPWILKELSQGFMCQDFSGVLRLRSVITYSLSRFIDTYIKDITLKIKIATKYQEMHAFIEKSLHTKFNAQMVADHLHIPLYRLNREYKQDTGITITQYIHSQILSKASIMLLLTKKTIKEISYELGFTDEFYFSRFFKKEMNYSPREYRLINGQMNNKINKEIEK